MSLAILVVDNYDSFVFNLAQYLQQLGAEVTVVRNDEVDLGSVSNYDGVLLSPGPGTPADSGVCPQIISEFGATMPILGVCLGHQAIAEVYGGVVDRAPELLNKAFVQDDIRVRELIVERPTLEDVFLERTGHGDIR